MSTLLVFIAITSTNTFIRTISKFVAFMGFLIVIWTQSRGVWAALPLIPVVIFFYATKHWANWKQILMVAISVIMISSSYLHPTVKNRIDLTFFNVARYLESTDHLDKARHTSMGTRFEMWKTGWRIFLDNPILGVGLARWIR